MYMILVNMDVLTENLTSAGMPEGWLEDLLTSEEPELLEDNAAEFEEETDMAGDTLDDSETPAA